MNPINRAEQARPNSAKASVNEESDYYVNGGSRRSLVICEPTTSWETILKMTGRTATKVTANHPVSFYSSLVNLWITARDGMGHACYVRCYGEYSKAKVETCVVADDRDTYMRGIAWSIYHLLIDGQIHFISTLNPIVEDVVGMFREICELLIGHHDDKVVFIVDDNIISGEVREFIQACYDLGDVWMKESEFQKDNFSFIKKLGPAMCPKQSILDEVTKAI